ncbi:MAG TPA: MMPL family transporter, partial [Solirubrobacteraceae bacterium]|nr:MMPL family transporter [Solirubrobacteraceae bacterium]
MTTSDESLRTSRYARWLVRLRFLVVPLWIAGAIAAWIELPSLRQADLGALGELVPEETSAIRTEQRAAREFGFPLLSRTMLVEHDPRGLSTSEQARIASRAARLTAGEARSSSGIAAAVPVLDVLEDGRFRPERATTAVTYLFFERDVDVGAHTDIAGRLAARAAQGVDHTVRVTGVIAAREQQANVVDDRLPLLTLATVLIVAIVVGLHFRAPLAPVLTLLSVALAYVVATRTIAVIGEAADLAVPREVEPVIVVLLFGIVTDYSVFFLSRFRQRLADGVPPRRAAESAIAELQGIVLTAGLIVAAASAALVVAQLDFFQVFGPGMALAVLVGLFASLTFFPACLALFGRAVLWPRGAHLPR